MEIETTLANKSDHVYIKTKKHILIDNFLGGMAWGLGSVIGATIIVGILGIFIVRTSNIPLLGDLVKVVMTEIQSGANELINSK